jgi:hypothetical protein
MASFDKIANVVRYAKKLEGEIDCRCQTWKLKLLAKGEGMLKGINF